LVLQIAFDIDGVVLDFVSAFCAVCRQEGYSLDYDQITEYHMGKVLGVDDEEFYRLLDLTFESGLIRPYPGAVEGLRSLRDAGWKIWFVTSRPERLRTETITTLDAATITYDRLIFADAKRKADHVAGVKRIVEDSLEEALELESKGFGVIMFRHPWNVAGENRYSRISWVGSWRELVPVVLSLATNPSGSS
jgi:phosphoglycolate phosphatase-like HAD superfamily hydrolase